MNRAHDSCRPGRAWNAYPYLKSKSLDPAGSKASGDFRAGFPGVDFCRDAPLCNGDACSAMRISGFTLPLCARCLSLIAGLIFAALLNIHLPVFGFMLLVPVVIDGGLHYAGIFSSSNRRRLATGFPGGIAAWSMTTDISIFLQGV
ncbi:MAG: DUF2085 domain-containing protein [Wenzhouxiangellaceae bacterium]|nr:DUF2085 domain-containing protein [Wenzhouxiangellaceae bacterium]